MGDAIERDEEDRVSAIDFFVITLGESIEFVGHGSESGVTVFGVSDEVLAFKGMAGVWVDDGVGKATQEWECVWLDCAMPRTKMSA